MKNLWKRRAAVLGVAALVVSQSYFVLAEEELSVQENQEEIVESELGQIQPATDLKWDEKTGKGYFTNPNNSTVWWSAKLYKKEDSGYNGTYKVNGKPKAINAGDTDEIELYHIFDGSGTYHFQIIFSNEDGSETYVESGYSPVFEYVETEDDGDGKESDTRSLQPATDLKWNERGQGIFYNPNEAAVLMAHVYYGPNQEDAGSFYDGWVYTKETVVYDLYHVIEAYGQSGEYTFAVEAIYWNGEVRVLSEPSESFSYTKPTVQLSEPKFTVSKSGLVSCEIPGADEYVLGDDYGVNYEVYEGDTRIFQQGTNVTELDLGEMGVVGAGHKYLIKVQALSRRIDKLVSSKWSEYILDLSSEEGNTSTGGGSSDPGSSSSSAGNNSSSAGSNSSPTVEAVPKAWQPTTPDELERYAAYGREKVEYTTDATNNYLVTVYNAMPGRLCYDSFEAVLGEYVIGRTYNIFPLDKIVYQMDSKARIILNIPKALQADNREFQMICVTANGRPIVLKDLDTNPGTITFETDTYYAFALTYKDIK